MQRLKVGPNYSQGFAVGTRDYYLFMNTFFYGYQVVRKIDRDIHPGREMDSDIRPWGQAGTQTSPVCSAFGRMSEFSTRPA